MTTDIEHLGWDRCLWSGFRWFRATDFEELCDYEPNWTYADGAVVIGFWVYRYRVWRIYNE